MRQRLFGTAEAVPLHTCGAVLNVGAKAPTPNFKSAAVRRAESTHASLPAAAKGNRSTPSAVGRCGNDGSTRESV